MRRIILIILLWLPLLGFAQNEMQTINAIKGDTTFLYATGTSSVSYEEASGIACDLIGLEIEQWLKESAVTDVAGYIAKSKDSLSHINTKRGNFYRAFVYVKKQDILPYTNKEKVMVVDFQNLQAKADTTDTIVPQDSIPLPEERTLPDTLQVEPQEKIDTIAPQDSIPIIVPKEQTLSSASLEEVSQVKADTVVPRNLPKETLEKPKETLAKPKETTDTVSQPVYTPTSQESSLLEITSFTALNEYINQGRKDGTVVGVGNYKNLPAFDSCYVFIHNREGQIPAVIKWQDAKAVNIATGRTDTIPNYKGCGAIWIKLKTE